MTDVAQFIVITTSCNRPFSRVQMSPAANKIHRDNSVPTVVVLFSLSLFCSTEIYFGSPEKDIVPVEQRRQNDPLDVGLLFVCDEGDTIIIIIIIIILYCIVFFDQYNNCRRV